MSNDYTYKKYRELLEAIKNRGYKCYTLKEWIEETPETGIVMRHDVDRYPKNSLHIAFVEKELEIKSTYYFRANKCSFNHEIIKEISSMGHEIGYHYEDLSDANGDHNKAIDLFKDNLNRLREISEVRTISMHGRPMSKFDNRDLWKKYNILDYELTGEAYLTINYKDIYYFSDTGRTWNDNGINIRDKVATSLKMKLSNTDSLISFINHNSQLKIAILTHPERWNDNKYLWYKYYLRDLMSNNSKRIVQFARKNIKNN